MKASKCSTTCCRGNTYLFLKDKPLCEVCWERHCEVTEPHPVTGRTTPEQASLLLFEVTK